MSEKNEDSGKVREPHATYRVLRARKAQRPVKAVLKELAELRKQLSKRRTDGKDVVTLVREERER